MKASLEVENQVRNIYTTIVTASLTTPAIVTVTALVTETSMYSVNTCEKNSIKIEIDNCVYKCMHTHHPKQKARSISVA